MKRRLVVTAVVAIIAIALGTAATRTHRIVDLTDHDTLTLTDQTNAVLDRLPRRVTVTAFVRREEPGRVEAVALLARYRDETSRFVWRVVDPDDAPGEVARLGVDPVFGGVALASGTKTQLASAATEQDLTAALARLTNTAVPEVCVTTGQGEDALRSARALLERGGYRTTSLDLLSTPTVPDRCAAVVLAGPTAPLTADALAALATWTAADGKMLVLADPAASADVDLAPVLTPLGLGITRGLVFEGDSEAVVAGDVTSPVVRSYSSGHPVVRRLAPTYFPGVQGIDVVDDKQTVSGLTVSRLADTSETSYLETAPASSGFDPTQDRPGPVTVVAAADRSRNTGTRIARTRVVVIGDADFASDRFLGQAGNAALFTRSVEWLTAGEDVAAITPNLGPERMLGLTDARVTYARAVTAGVIPALFLLAGAMVWAARRNR
ncbi:MAG: Gldg family protein [Actinobacteria bacterium]|nr:Gldg family protein [Actinomycetota bacterium]